MAYDALGNITEKSDICATANCMVHGANGAGPYPLTSIVGTCRGVMNPTFTYDANGNQLGGPSLAAGYTSFNLPAGYQPSKVEPSGLASPGDRPRSGTSPA